MLVVGLAGCAPSAASAQTGSAEPRVPVSGLVGLARPSDATFREVYASGVVPFSAQVDARLRDLRAEVFAGVRFVRNTGEAIGNSAAQATVSYRLSRRVS